MSVAKELVHTAMHPHAQVHLYLLIDSFSPPPPRIAIGAAYGTAKSGVGISAMAVMRPDLIMKSVIPVVMAGIIGIYGLVVSVVIVNNSKLSNVTLIHTHTHMLMCDWSMLYSLYGGLEVVCKFEHDAVSYLLTIISCPHHWQT